MSVKIKSIKSDLKKNDAHEIQLNEYEKLPELTDAMFERAIYKVAGVEKPAPQRRGSQKSPKKIAISLRLPPDVVEYFKSEGAGWQSKISSVLQS